jgi:hypothetical protein
MDTLWRQIGHGEEETRMNIPGNSTINLVRYSLADKAAREKIVQSGREQIRHNGCATFPEFLSPDALERIVGEIDAAFPHASRRDRMLTAYDEPTGPHASIARSPTSPYRMWTVFSEQWQEGSNALATFENEELTDLVRDILELPALYRVADTKLRCVATILGDGDQHGWHFDENDFVVSLLVQKPVVGGEFEFAPNIRTDDNPNYEVVDAIIEGAEGHTAIVPTEAGTLVLFCGKYALHRVTPVVGERPRMILLFSYDTQPDMRHSKEVHEGVLAN